MAEDLDAEVSAMASIAGALEGLSEDSRARVIRWARDRYAPGGEGKSDEHDDEQTRSRQEWEHFADLFDATGPDTESERLLVAAFWTSVVEGHTEFGSAALNTMLKDLGHPADDVSHSMQRLIDHKPAFILQLKKSGSTKQARKTYKITVEGVKKVKAMIA